MSDKKPKSTSAKNTSKKPASGKVTKPLRRASAAKSGQTSDKAAGSRKAKLFDRIKKSDTKRTHASARNPKSKRGFLGKASGASSRGGFEQDKNRFRTVWGLALVILVLLIGRAYYIQVANAQFYQDKGNELITSERTQKSYRGMITDRNDLPLAVSAPLATVSFSPHDYASEYYELKRIILTNPNSPQLQARMQKRLDNMDLTTLAAAANISVDELKKATAIDDSIDVTDEAAVKAALPSGAGSHYLPLLNKVTPEIAQSVSSLDFPGVYEKNFFQRYYPQPQSNAQLLGFMGQNANDPEGGYEGRAGIERQYEKDLAGDDGKVLVLKDAKQNSLKEIKQLEPEIPGKDVALTIDSRLQYLLYKELEKAGRLQKARWSTGMIVDVQTGEVLALSTWPSFNSNNLNEMTGENQRNRALLDVFEPGSVMKPFTVAAALDSGKYTPTTLIDTNPGSIRVRGYTIRDHNNLGMINMATLLQKSSNVASTKIALSLPPDAITNMQRQFGFGSKTPLQFPGEGSGLIVTPKEKETSRRATVSYGYGLQVTLAQVAQAYSALAAGGVMHPLTLIKDDKPQPSKRIMAREQAMSIVQMLESVTEAGGTARAAAIDGYRVAGKTGTSRRINPEGGYYSDQYRNVFAGMAPASNPKLVGVMLIEDPRGQIYAGLTVAPVFHNVMKEALRLYNVPLDKPLKTEPQ
ncbi:peptidoglycan D,D-transpeptidase FtsI family protein [Psychrobacter pacificensis]|uniref:peptidoglycan D,D-transpeptidase FtsI family protein n=1 Tax=Psychrobacter pacificensis TaxID=112002 RepID=UPI001CC1899F|nr:penicillin-binding protein 2 [Psychrobacter pacificensis]MBZ1392469.1 penicillin-binding protein 2 [Psychrobacter pacificensis]MDE0843330.1 penicillin-binding protein 2 [Psychrobacter pacificensis]